MANNPENQEKTEEGIQIVPPAKQVLFIGVVGKVKWFNVKRGYGFVCRKDTNEDVFIHQSAIVKSNPTHPRRSVGDGEDILFDIVKGEKGNEAANVCGADGNHVIGSEYALRYPKSGRGRPRGGRGRGGGRGGPIRSRGPSEDYENHSQEYIRGGPPRGGRSFRGGDGRNFRGGEGRSFRGGGRPYFVQYRKSYPDYEMPPPPTMYYDYEYFPGRGRGGFRGSQMFRGGGPPQPRDMSMNFIPYDYEGGYERRPSRGGRGRFRNSRWRGGRGRGVPRNSGQLNDEGEEHHEEKNTGEHRD